MDPFTGVLEMFRHSFGAPGAPAPGAVPADPRADLAAEVRPLFDELDRIQAEAEALIRSARTRAERIQRRSAAGCVGIIARARDRLPELRADAESTARAQVAEPIAQLDVATAAEVARISARSDAAVPVAVARVLDHILAYTSEPSREVGHVAGLDRR